MDTNNMQQDTNKVTGDSPLQKMVYTISEDGQQTYIAPAGVSKKIATIKQVGNETNDLLDDIEARIKAGELSPIAYYLEKNRMTIETLAELMEKWQWQVRKHLEPKVFNDLHSSIIQQYAHIFNITVDKLLHFGETENGE
jgi:hypothetical protein